MLLNMSEKKQGERALVVFSGGQDSTTCLYWAKQHFKKVVALTFSYGQKHSLEIAQAQKIAEMAAVEWHLIGVPLIGQLGSNALTDPTLPMDKATANEKVPNTFVPGRNLFFLSIAAVFARERGIFHLVTGVSEADYSGYPDCRATFMKSLNTTLNLAMDETFHIHTPLMLLDKSQVWQLSDELGVLELIRNQSLTCYNGVVGEGCGECPACNLRQRGLTLYLERKQASYQKELLLNQ